MKLIIFSDVHGNIEALDLFLKKLDSIDFDLLIFGGDVFGYYYHPAKVLDRLIQMKSRLSDSFVWLLGNHDQYFLELCDGKRDHGALIEKYGHSYDSNVSEEQLSCLRQRKPMEELIISGKRYGFFHGMPGNELEGRLYPNNEIDDATLYEKYDIVFQGHTHCQMDRILQSGENGHFTRILNPGSIGQPRDGRGHTYLEYDTETEKAEIHSITMDYKKLYREIDQYDPGLSKLKEVLERKPS